MASCFGDTTLGVKTIGEAALDWTKGQTGVSDTWSETFLLILSSGLSSRLSAKLIGGCNLDGSGLVIPSVTYTLVDGLILGVKFFAFFGDSTTKFGAWNNNDLFKLTMDYTL